MNNNTDSKKSLLQNNDLNFLINYYEKHPDQFKSDWNEKQIIVKEGKIYIKPQYIKDVLKMIDEAGKTSDRMGIKHQDLKKIEKLTCDSIIKTVQELVNVGDLQSAYYIYFALHERIPFPENSVKVWAQAYIGISFLFNFEIIFLELLRTYQFYQESNEIIRSCPLQIISDGNKVEYFLN